MKKLIIIFFILLPIAAWAGCYSDYDCGIGYACVKAPMSYTGRCMQTVDRYKIPDYQIPKSNSIFPNIEVEGDCRWDTDCPLGFRCHWKYKVCVSN